MSAAAAPVKRWTIDSILRWTQAHLEQHHSPTPRLDAEVLLAHVLGCARLRLYTHYDQPLDADETAAFGKLVRRRVAQEPVAYIVGEREFFGLKLQVSPAVLIPRPETELVVDTALAWLGDREAPRLLDVGTGSGALAIALCHQLPTAQAVAVDISTAALAVARANVQRHGLQERITLVHSDLDAALDAAPFDVVVANLPYVRTAAPLPASVRNFEPATALFGGADGLDLIRRLAARAPQRLRRPGALILEIDAAQSAAVNDALAAVGPWQALQTRCDLQGLPRVVLATMPAATPVAPAP